MLLLGGHGGGDRMVVRFTTTYAICAYHLQHYVIKFVINLRQVGGFLRVLQFPPPTKLIVPRCN